MAAIIAVNIPEDSLSTAAIGLGLDLSQTSRSGVVRAALALFHGASRQQAKEYVQPKRPAPARLGSDGQERVTAQIPDDLAEVGEPGMSYAVRYGLAIAAGATPKQADNFAQFSVRPVGRPRKNRENAA